MGEIVWNEKISVDGGIIDADHKHLIAISNLFINRAQVSDKEELCEIIDDLEHYATAHFRREEAIQAAIEYQDAATQRAEHAELLSTLSGIAERLHAAAPEDMGSTKKEISTLIRRWLLDHILKSDLKMAPYRDLVAAHEGRLVALDSDRHRGNRIIGTSQFNDLKIDGGTIDADHKELVITINDFILAENEGADQKRLKELLSVLNAYARVHFEREERLQLAVGFPFHEAHKRTHRELIADLNRIGEELLRTHSPDRHGILSSFLRNWLVNHVQQSDKTMLPYVQEMRGMRSRSAR